MKRTAKYYSKNADARRKKLRYDKEFQKRPAQVKKRVEANRANREDGTYGNGDGKDYDHAVGKMVDQSVNRGRKGEGGRKKKVTYKHGGRLKYFLGGNIDTDPPKGSKPPIYVNDPNDPRLVAYQDSAAAHDWSSKMLETIIEDKKTPNNIPVDSKNIKYKTPEQILQERIRRVEPLGIPSSSVRQNMMDSEITNRGTNQKNKAVSYAQFSNDKDVFELAQYAKPNQPVELASSNNSPSAKSPQEEIISQIQSDPKGFYQRLSTDKDFQAQIGSMFQGDDLENLYDARANYFASKGKATISSPEIEELMGGRRIENLEDYQNLIKKYEGASKVLSYDDSDEDDRVFNSSIKLINKLSSKHRPKQEISEKEQRELMELKRQMGIDTDAKPTENTQQEQQKQDKQSGVSDLKYSPNADSLLIEYEDGTSETIKGRENVDNWRRENQDKFQQFRQERAMKPKKKVTYKMGGKMDKKKSKGITYKDGGKMEYGYGGKMKYAYGGKKKVK